MDLHRFTVFLALAVVILFNVNPGYSQCGHDYFWASWSNFTGNSATGTLTTNTQTVNVTMTANYMFDFTNNIYNYAAFNGFSGNLPPNTRVPKTTWAVGSGGETTMCFSETVSNPVLLIASLGRIDTIVTIAFSRSYITIFDGGDMSYPNDRTLIGQEGYAIIMFPGEFDCITIFSTTPEWYTNITWGLNTPLFEIDLVGDPVSCDSTTITASGGSTYNWNGGSNPNSAINTFTESGVYFITVTDDNSCTVVSSVTIDIFSDAFVSVQESICEGEVYLFNNQPLTQAGQYEAIIQTIHGCDSTINLNLEVNPVQNEFYQIVICEGESYLFNGQNLTNSGNYEAVFQNTNGCDSTINLNLVVNPKSQTIIQHHMCEGEFYTFAGQQLSSSGIYLDTLQNTNSCDSIISLTLTVTSFLETNIQQNICEGESFQFGDIIINEEGEYSDTLISTGGCDSIITLSLKVIETQTYAIDANICEGESFDFGGDILTESGEYTSTFQTVDGCDSIVNLVLVISENFYLEDTIEICESYLWPQTGLTYSSSGVYTHPLQTVNGCDSIYSLRLSILPSFQFEESIDALNSYIWPVNGENYLQSGTFEVFYKTMEGCDSTYKLNLIINIPKNVFVPDAFSPNADGVNDRFTIFGNETLEWIESLNIFDRWGNLLAAYKDFPPNDTSFGWDGLGRGLDLNPGVYIYTAQVRFTDGSTSLLTGDITKTK